MASLERSNNMMSVPQKGKDKVEEERVKVLVSRVKRSSRESVKERLKDVR